MNQTFKNIYLLKMGTDEQNGLNHRIRFVSNNCMLKGEQVRVCIDFMLMTPYCLETAKNKNKYKTIYGKENSALAVDFQYTNSKGTWGLSHKFNEVIKVKLEHCEAPFDSYLKYSYENILKIINFLLNADYNNIILLDSRYIKNFIYNNFFSDEYIHNEKAYQNALDFKAIAEAKIRQIKSECRYDNSSYYYENNLFKIVIHYNCYNDCLTFDLDNMEEAIKQINQYIIPEEKIRIAISQHGIKSSKLYL